MHRAVEGRSDAAVERTVGSRAGVWLIFKGMERAFVPEAAQGFTGEIAYVFSTAKSDDHWTVVIEPARARAERRRAVSPAVTLSMPRATFARIAARATNPITEAMSGTLRIDGDAEIALRLAAMFGESLPSQ